MVSDTKIVNALDKPAASQRQFVSYAGLSSDRNEFNRRAQFIERDLSWLLELSFEDFWNEVVHQTKFRPFLRSFLLNATCSEDAFKEESEQSVEQRRIYRMFFMVFLRLSVNCSEEKDIRLKDELFTENVYKLISFLDIVSFCSIYVSTNPKLTAKIAENLLDKQPKYREDLRLFLGNVVSSVQNLADGITKNVDDTDSRAWRSCQFAYDTTRTLRCLLQVLPTEMCAMLYPNGILVKLLQTLDELSEAVVTRFPWIKHEDQPTDERKRAYKLFTLAEYNAGMIIDEVVERQLLTPIRQMGQSDTHVEHLYLFFSELMRLHRMSAIYDQISPIAITLTSLSERQKNKQSNEQVQETISASNNQDLDDSVRKVKEIFPDLSDHFVKACLDSLTTSENVINSLLEDNLPDTLKRLRDEPEPAPPVESPLVRKVLDERKNVYDYDEYDVFHRDDIAIDKIHIGKKELDQNEDRELLKKMTLLLASQQDKEPSTDIGSHVNIVVDEYGDDYDDSYEETAALPKGLADDTAADQEDGNDEKPKLSFKPFCEDPSVIRQRREARLPQQQQGAPSRRSKKYLADRKRNI